MGVVAPATVICSFIPQISLAEDELSGVGVLAQKALR